MPNFVLDTYDGTAGADLNTRPADIGGTYRAPPTGAAPASGRWQLNGSGSLESLATTGNFELWVAPTSPPTSTYYHEAEFTLTSPSSGGQCRLLLFDDVVTYFNGFELNIYVDSGAGTIEPQFTRYVSGSGGSTTYGDPISYTSGVPFVLRFEIPASGDNARAYVDGTLVATNTGGAGPFTVGANFGVWVSPTGGASTLTVQRLQAADLAAPPPPSYVATGTQFTPNFGAHAMTLAPITVHARPLYAPQIQHSWAYAVIIPAVPGSSYASPVQPTFQAGQHAATASVAVAAVGAQFATSFGAPRAARAYTAAGAQFAPSFGLPTQRTVVRARAARFVPAFSVHALSGAANGLGGAAVGARFPQRFGRARSTSVFIGVASGFSTTEFGVPTTTGAALLARAFGVNARFGSARLGG